MAERFHGVDAPAGDARRERQAGEPRRVVDQHRAGAALAAVASRFCAGEADEFPQIIQQQKIVRHRIDARPAVEA